MSNFNHDAYTDAYLRSILETVESVAIVGASAKKIRPSFFVTQYLADKGYKTFPINPGQAGREIAGAKAYASLADLPQPVDMVDIFRKPEALPAIVDEVFAMPERPKVVWMQLAIRDDAIAGKLEQAGIKVVMNRCPKIEYARLCGEIAWVGFNRRTISSKKAEAREGISTFYDRPLEVRRWVFLSAFVL